MDELLFSPLVLIVIFTVRWINTSSDYKLAKKLNAQFSEWLTTKDKSSRPSNADFNSLFKKCYGDGRDTIPYKVATFGVIFTEKADILLSFPTASPVLLIHELRLLDNLEEHFYFEYRRTFSVKYWVNFLVFLPQKIFAYFNLNEDQFIAKLFNLIYWILTGLWALYKKQLFRWLIQLIS